MKKIKILYVLGSLLFLMIGAQAQALIITPLTTPQWNGTETGVSAIYDEWNALFAPGTYDVNNIATWTVGSFNELYKQNVDDTFDTGTFATSYNTSFTPSTDPSYATIEWIGGAYIGSSPTYLLVKGGAQTPAWYGFDISTWNGQETIYINDFWMGKGAISHVSVYGTAPIPEPATMLLLGAGIVGITGARLLKKDEKA
jgi:PEP-CTERM motif